jgi:hypothetical protein
MTSIFAALPSAEGYLENLSAIAVLGAGFLVGVRWILAHITKLSDRQFEIMNGLLRENHKLIGEVAEILRQNNHLLGEVGDQVGRCAIAEKVLEENNKGAP